MKKLLPDLGDVPSYWMINDQEVDRGTAIQKSVRLHYWLYRQLLALPTPLALLARSTEQSIDQFGSTDSFVRDAMYQPGSLLSNWSIDNEIGVVELVDRYVSNIQAHTRAKKLPGDYGKSCLSLCPG